MFTDRLRGPVTHGAWGRGGGARASPRCGGQRGLPDQAAGLGLRGEQGAQFKDLRVPASAFSPASLCPHLCFQLGRQWAWEELRGRKKSNEWVSHCPGILPAWPLQAGLTLTEGQRHCQVAPSSQPLNLLPPHHPTQGWCPRPWLLPHPWFLCTWASPV